MVSFHSWNLVIAATQLSLETVTLPWDAGATTQEKLGILNDDVKRAIHPLAQDCSQ